MDRQKLLGIIVKDLEELKFLSEEITENEEKSNLIIDLALSKARLLCQEIEVLKEISAPVISQPGKEETAADNALEETSDEEEETISVAEPELEIINFEHPDLKEDNEDDETEEEDENEDDEGTDDDLTDEEDEEESIESEIEEPVFEVAGEEENEEPEENEDDDDDDREDFEEDLDDEDDDLEEDAEEEPEMDAEIETEDNTPLKETSKPEFREIALDDDDDIETIPVAPSASAQKAPVFREIPKPEEPTAEKTTVAEAFQKERSLNDAIGENQTTESKIATGPISNLRAAIGLNDRFLFIREIFDNNAEKYNNIIENLDKMETIQQAVEYLKANLTLQKNETSMKFVELLKRRFTK